MVFMSTNIDIIMKKILKKKRKRKKKIIPKFAWLNISVLQLYPFLVILAAQGD